MSDRIRQNNRYAIAAVVLIILAVLLYANYQSDRAEEAESNIAFETAKIIDLKFSKSTTLRVATISGKIIARADDQGFAGLIPTSQTRKLPFSTDYFVELGKVGIDNYRWQETENTMIIEIPDVTASKPNLDEASQVANSPTGVFVSRGASVRLQQQLSKRASSAATAEAKKIEHLEKARQAAREAVKNIISAPLKAAGLGNVNIVIRFPWEEKGSVAERWDESTPLSEIIKRVENQE